MKQEIKIVRMTKENQIVDFNESDVSLLYSGICSLLDTNTSSKLLCEKNGRLEGVEICNGRIKELEIIEEKLKSLL